MQFRDAAIEFEAFVNTLVVETRSKIPQAQKLLDGDEATFPGTTSEQCAERCLRGVSKRIEDIMGLYDEMLKAMGFSPRYSDFFTSDET